ncbi:MAG TPA: anthranilate phosphoribosyltransferase [Candidatus Dormibacteraeota bacterium]|nr:anthranilate phosphoribosyltransferase [Candidatus Dormibacteraeota bacterium]
MLTLPAMIREAIHDLVAGHDLDRERARASMDDIMSGEATESQVAGFLVALRMKGETVEELVGMVESMRDHATTITAPDGAVDTCGTGGDGAGTFNISTAAALVMRGAGAVVAKHGARASSSACGSADVLEALGVAVTLPPPAAEECLRRAGIAFLFAPNFHPSMRHAAVPRRELGVRTVFNLLGPLANPARVRRQSVGVGSAEATEKMALVLAALGHERALVFHGAGGLDELSTEGPSQVFDVGGGEVRRFQLDPADFGLPPASRGAIQGGDAQRNAAIVRSVLDGDEGAPRDVVLLNAAAGLLAAGIVTSIQEGLTAGRESIRSGGARTALQDLVQTSNSLVG